MESGWPIPFRSTISTPWSSTAARSAASTLMFRSVIDRRFTPADPITCGTVRSEYYYRRISGGGKRTVGSLRGIEQQSQVGGPDLLVGIETESAEDVSGTLAHLGDVVAVGCLGLDLDELPQAVDAVERDGVAVEREEGPVLLDDRRRLEPQAREDPCRLIAVGHRGLVFLSGLRFRLDERPLIRHPGRRLRPFPARLPHSLPGLLPEPERLVGLRELPMGSVVVGIDLADPPIGSRTDVVERRPHGFVIGAEFEFDLVHTSGLDGDRKSGPIPGVLRDTAGSVRPNRNVILKGHTGDYHGMSDEQQADDDSPVDGDVPDDETNGHDDEDVVDETPEDAVADGDFVRLAYTLRTADDGEVVDTTDAEIAEDAEIDTDEYEFEPRVIVIGAGHVFESVDEALIGQEVGATGTVEISAEEAFGEYDDDQVRTVSANKIDEENRYPGAQVQIDGDQGRIITVVSGRARVDFNHPLAGEDLEYEYEILDLVDDREEQAASLLGMYLQQSPEVWIQTDVEEEEQVVEIDDEDEDEVETELEVVETEQETLYIEATPQMTMNQQWMFSKQQIAQDVMDRLDLDRVIVQETIDGSGGMMGGLGGMMGGGGPGGAAPEDIEEAIEDVDVDADELAEELDADIEE